MQVYLDNAASTQLHPEALKEMLPYLGASFGNPSSIHAFGRKQKAAIENVRRSIASFLGAKSSEIFFCASGTEANNIALKLAASDLKVERILTTELEHKCVLNTAKYLQEEHGVRLEFIRTNTFGQVDLSDLERLLKIDSQKTLVSLMHIQNELGAVNDLNAIGALCDDHDALFHSDTVQSIGHFNIDVKESKLTFLSASAHKFNGPLGVGFLYKKANTPLRTWIHGGGHERNLRSSTENVAGIVGMGKALSIAYQNLDEDSVKMGTLKAQLKQGLREINSSILFNEQDGQSTFTILSVSIPNELIQDTFTIQLDMAGIAVSAGSACTSGASKISDVIKNLNLNPDCSTLRFSFSTFTTIEEIKYVVDFFKKELSK
ncbi:MAG: cysteine desulfurase [Chitinophagales bacterium]|jgi:cysteine desulfurase